MMQPGENGKTQISDPIWCTQNFFHMGFTSKLSTYAINLKEN